MTSHLPQFENVQVDIDSLPAITDLELFPMEKKYLSVRLLGWVIWCLVLVAMLVFALFLMNKKGAQWGYWIPWTAFTFLSVVSLIFSYFGFHQMAYALRERDIYFKKGLVYRKSTIVPFNRIQHCEVNHGPIDRFFGIASLKIFTAGSSNSDLSIPGLTESKAHRLKDFITKKTGMDEEE